MKKLIFLLSAMLLLVSASVSAQEWVTTWATAEQLVESGNLPPSPGLSGNSLRQIVQVSVGGDIIRLKFSNEFSTGSTEIKAVEVAKAKTAGSSSDVDATTTKSLTFNGKAGVIMEAGETATSDAIEFDVDERDNIAITIHYGTCSNTSITGHPGSRTTSYLAKGNTTSFSGATKTEHWYNIWAIDVKEDEQDEDDNYRAVAVLGNSITDGRGSTTNNQDRWCDALSRRLLENDPTEDVAMINMGIGGNCVLSGGLGPCAKQRYARDLFGQEGVKYIILFEAVNDLGYCSNGTTTANNIIGVYKQIIQEAHNRGILAYCATITPFKNSSYFSTEHEKGRQILNQWIREGGYSDGVIDFDKAVRDPSDTLALKKDYLYQNDWLHLNASGYKAMAEAVDLNLFTRKFDIEVPEEPEEYKCWIEAERMTEEEYGTNFKKVADKTASNGYYMLTNKNTTDLTKTKENILRASFNIPEDGDYYVYARLKCTSYNDDSYFFTLDDGEYSRSNGLYTGDSWEWKELISYIDDGTSLSRNLTQGTHTISIVGREDGAQFDKLCITTANYAPTDMGEDDPVVVGVNETVNSKSADAKVYNLQGQVVSGNPPAGIYIKGNRKVLILQ